MSYPLKKLWEIWIFLRWITYSKWDLLPEYQKWCVSLLRANNINEGLLLNDLQYLPKGFIKEEKVLEENDIIFCMSSWSKHLVWKNTIIPKLDNYSFWAFCSMFRLNSENNINYIWYFLVSDYYKNYIYNFSQWVNILNLKNTDLENMEIPLPPFSTQKAIVQKLDTAFEKIDANIELAQKNLENVEELGMSVLEEFFWDNKFKEAIFWEVCDFVRWPFWGSLKKEIFKKSWYAIYEQMHAIWNQYSEIRYFIDEEKFNEMKRFELKPWNLIMSCSWTMWKVSIVPQWIKKWIINQALLALKSKKELTNRYLKLFMESIVFQDEITKYSKWAAIKNVASVKILKQIKIPLPPLEKQKEIVEHLDKVFEGNKRLKENYEEKIASLREMKQSLLRDAFEGRLVSE